MSRLDDIKEAYDNIQVPAELKERVLQSMERGKKDACGEKKESGKAFAGKSERNQKKGHLLPFVRVAEAVAAAVAVLVISVNVSPTVANAMEQVPVLGAIVKIVNFTTYSDKQEKKQMEANQFAGEQHWRIFFNAGNGKGAFGKGVVCFADCGYGTADFDDDALGQCNGSATARKRGDFNRFRADAILAIPLLDKGACVAKLGDPDGSLCGAGYDDGL